MVPHLALRQVDRRASRGRVIGMEERKRDRLGTLRDRLPAAACLANGRMVAELDQGRLRQFRALVREDGHLVDHVRLK